MSDRKDLAWARSMGPLYPSRVLKSELPGCGARSAPVVQFYPIPRRLSPARMPDALLGAPRTQHLCRYITRPAIAHECLALNRAGQLVLTLKTAYREGTTHIVMSPLEFLQRLAALVPRPRLHLIRVHGVLAPHARLRPEVIPGVLVNAHTPQPTTPRRPLLRRLPA